MARQSIQFSLNSLKGKVRLAAVALAFFVLITGLISYLITSFLTTDSIFVIFVPFSLLSGAIVVVGWWFSNEIVRPVEKISLLAKSLERGVTTSLPKTSGSSETDALLQSLQRSNLQIQNIVNLMDKVADGKLDIALAPLQNSDRLSASFQKLLVRVSESINAHQKLERLQAAVNRVSNEVSAVRNGSFDVKIASDDAKTKEIAESFAYLIEVVNELISQIRSETQIGRTSANEARKTIESAIQEGEIKVQEINRAKLTLKQIPGNVQKISEELYASASTANQAIEKARGGAQTARRNLEAVGTIRKQIYESAKRIQKIGERSREIFKVAKIIEDLAHRTNMIALNASLQAAKSTAESSGFSVIAEEVEMLAVRAENTNKQIFSLNKTIAAEIGELERSLQSAVGEAANLSKYAVESGDFLSEMEKYVVHFTNAQAQLAAFSSEQSAKAENVFQTFIEFIEESKTSFEKLKKSENHLAQIIGAAENLQLSAADYKISTPAAEEPAVVAEYAAPLEVIYGENV